MPTVTLLGIPWDASSSFQRGAAGAPPEIRKALWSGSSNTWNERGDDLAAAGVLEDAGDIELGDDPAAARTLIESRVRDVLAAGHRPLILGGDHSITYPVLRAFAGRTDRLTILHFDAHADLYDSFPLGPFEAPGRDRAVEVRYSHACPFARVMEERLAARVVQVGVRTLTAHLRSQAGKFGVEVLGADRWRDALPLVTRLRGSVYVSLDLDVLEPMLAPGLSHPEPGGLAVRDVLDVLSAISATVVGADIVEYNPRNDVRDLTARVAAKFVKEFVGILRR
jgi:arginase